MSFFFNKSESQDNLQYDDTAFMHFTIALSAATIAIFVALVARDISARKKDNIALVKDVPTLKAKL